MADRGVAADEDQLLERRACPARLLEQEKTLDGDVHDRFRGLLRRREVQDVRHVGHRFFDRLAIGDRTAHDLEPRRRVEHAVVAERAQRDLGEQPVGRRKHPAEKRLPDLARRSGHENAWVGRHAPSMTCVLGGHGSLLPASVRRQAPSAA